MEEGRGWGGGVDGGWGKGNCISNRHKVTNPIYDSLHVLVINSLEIKGHDKFYTVVYLIQTALLLFYRSRKRRIRCHMHEDFYKRSACVYIFIVQE